MPYPLVTPELIMQATGIRIDSNICFQNLGAVNTSLEMSLSFVDNKQFIPQLLKNQNITGAFVTKEIAGEIHTNKLVFLFCDDPRHAYYSLYNLRAKLHSIQIPSEIHHSALIHPSAYVSPHNVKIGENTIIEPNVTVLSDVTIGTECRIGAGTVLGCEEAEIKKTSRGIFRIIHDGRLVIGNRVDIYSNCTINKGFYNLDTVIGDDTKIASTTIIGHSSIIGNRCMLLCCKVLGSSVINDDVRINPGAIVANQVEVGESAEISIGAIAVQNVLPRTRVTGPIALEHSKFMHKYARTFGPF
ncbi:MAG: hypothetical protein AB7U43_00450 [Desulfobacter sp.]